MSLGSIPQIRAYRRARGGNVEETMSFGRALRATLRVMIGLASGFSIVTEAQSQVAIIADNDGIFIDGTTFQITPGKGKGAASAQIKALGARELGSSAIIFRSGEKLYIAAAPPLPSGGTVGRSVGLNADEPRPNRIRIAYDPPKTPLHQTLYDMLKERRVLETLQQILSPFRFRTELTIKTMGCDGMINSWYNIDDSVPTVHMCYELLQDILQTAPKETTSSGVTPRDAVVGQFLFWTLHEFGHAVFDIYSVPLFGREEDAADQFAVYIMLQFGKDRAHQLVEGAAYAANEFMKGYQQNPAVEKRLEKYSSVHGLPEQRFYNLMCMAYGADPKTFADVVENGFLPKKRAGNCNYEYETFSKAWRAEITPHIDQRMARTVLDTTWLPQ
jgi:hypothetical protein